MVFIFLIKSKGRTHLIFDLYSQEIADETGLNLARSIRGAIKRFWQIYAVNVKFRQGGLRLNRFN